MTDHIEGYMSSPCIPEQPDYQNFMRYSEWSMDEAQYLLASAQLVGSELENAEAYQAALNDEIAKINHLMHIPLADGPVFYLSDEFLPSERFENGIFYVVKNRFIPWAKSHSYKLPMEFEEFLVEFEKNCQETAKKQEHEISVAKPKPLKEIVSKVRGKAGAESRWSKRAPLIDCGVSYMQDQISKGCKCRHDILVKIALEKCCFENMPLKDHDKKGVNLNHVLKEQAKKLLPPDRIIGGEKYDPTIECPLSNHWGISHKPK